MMRAVDLCFHIVHWGGQQAYEDTSGSSSCDRHGGAGYDAERKVMETTDVCGGSAIPSGSLKRCVQKLLSSL
jgi:hypothetical protein